MVDTGRRQTNAENALNTLPAQKARGFDSLHPGTNSVRTDGKKNIHGKEGCKTRKK